MSTLLVSGSDDSFISYLIEGLGKGGFIKRFNDESSYDEILSNLSGANLFGESRLLLYKGSLKDKKIAELLYKYKGDRLILWLEKKPERVLIERFLNKVEVKVYNEGEDTYSKVLQLINFFKLEFSAKEAKEITAELGEDISRVYSFLYLMQGSGRVLFDKEILVWYKTGMISKSDPWSIWGTFEKVGVESALSLAIGTDPLALVGYIAYLAKKDVNFGKGRYCEGEVWERLIYLDRFAKFYKERAFSLIFAEFQRV